MIGSADPCGAGAVQPLAITQFATGTGREFEPRRVSGAVTGSVGVHRGIGSCSCSGASRWRWRRLCPVLAVMAAAAARPSPSRDDGFERPSSLPAGFVLVVLGL